MAEVVAYIAMGSNLGNRAATLGRAVEMLGRSPGVSVGSVSRLVETEPVGGPPGQGRYLNGAVAIRTTLSSPELLRRLKEIEKSLGRDRSVEPRWGPRTCDLDIALMGEQVVNEADLVIPHPRMHQRRFVLEGLAELAPAAAHPVRHKTMAQLLHDLDEAESG